MRLLSTAAAALTGAAFNDSGIVSRDQATVQVNIAAAATVTISGRLAPDLPFQQLEQVSASGTVLVPKCVQYRASVSGSTGQVDVELLDH